MKKSKVSIHKNKIHKYALNPECEDMRKYLEQKLYLF
jgi:hypothetical protein